MDKETFTEFERLKSALTDLEKCSSVIRDAKIVSSNSLKQVEDVISTFKNSSTNLISQFEYEAKVLADTSEKMNSDFNTYLRQFTEIIEKGLLNSSLIIDSLKNQFVNQNEVTHELQLKSLTMITDIKSNLDVVESKFDKKFQKYLDQHEKQEIEFTKLFERISKENKLLKYLIFSSLGLSIALIVIRIMQS